MAHLRSVGESTASPHDRYVTYTKLRCPTCDLRYLAVDDSEWGCESLCVYRQTARAAGLGRRRLASLLKALPAELDSTKKRARLYAARSLAEHYLHTGALAPLEALLVHVRKDVRREALETCWRGSVGTNLGYSLRKSRNRGTRPWYRRRLSKDYARPSWWAARMLPVDGLRYE